MTTGPDLAPRHLDVPNRLRRWKRRTPKSVKRLARLMTRTYGTYTAGKRALPDFLLIGTKRGGTTSLWNWLLSNPHVVPLFPATQQIKSPHYFDIHYDRGERWYRSHFPTRATLDSIATHTGHAPICGEASPYYLFHPLAAHRAQQAVPAAKIIVCLRNPTDRAYSHYWERRGGGLEPLTSFEAAIDSEQERLHGLEAQLLENPRQYLAAHDNFSYLARGRYLEQLERWLALFDYSQFHFVVFEDMKRDENKTFREVQDFLGLPIMDLPEQPPRYNRLPAPPMAESTRAKLDDYFRPYNAALAKKLRLSTLWLASPTAH